MSLIFALPSANATSWKQESAYWVLFHFSELAYNKPVASVFVHTGVLRGAEPSCRGRGYEPHSYWEAVENVPLVRTDHHFFGKKKFSVATGPCQNPSLGPIAQYWITFQDGSTLITESLSVPLTTEAELRNNPQEEFDRAVNRQDSVFSLIEDAWQTSGKVIQWEHAD